MSGRSIADEPRRPAALWVRRVPGCRRSPCRRLGRLYWEIFGGLQRPVAAGAALCEERVAAAVAGMEEKPAYEPREAPEVLAEPPPPLPPMVIFCRPSVVMGEEEGGGTA